MKQPGPWHKAYVGLGANLGDPAGQIRAALVGLGGVPGVRVLRSSSLYVSAPLDAPGQPNFINAVVMIETALAPHPLLRLLLDLEARLGRVRSFPNAPRALDLDLLLYGDETLDLPELQVPHPRMHLRRFVLEPLVEISPDATIPGHGSAMRLLAGLASQNVKTLAAS
ncbi:MAG: 2-amino-4-hydroxy-6-hydroxymethyldihydropteridine diphosphokinase [Betaproteobacteria bacterium RIFCSPLOWO2_02_FULL_62_17]|nr:MAG: 2-amino-4-hydroxy-6-hydroxymethyldihydropteridine diphosphokinase [Betaproteobacteria bacterium RIFCSPLOWO2_02_FULL_62_17]